MLLFLCAVVCFSAAACTLDLSHKHYLDKFGYCNSCQSDQTILLTKNADGEYVSEKLNLNTINETFIRFVSDGTSPLQITVNCITSEASSIVLFSKTDDYIASKYDKTNPVLICREPLTAGETYYVRIKFNRGGETTVKITPYSE